MSDGVLDKIARVSPADAAIFKLALELRKCQTDALSCLCAALERTRPGDRVSEFRESYQGRTIYGSARTGVGIVTLRNRTTLIVHVHVDQTIEVLGEFA